MPVASILGPRRTRIEALGITIHAGGFNPRPKKDAAKKIRLGTLSEHATGNAVDIDDEHNLIVSNEAWAFILATTGVGAIDHSPERWNTDPDGLFDDIARVSQAWRGWAASMVRAEAVWLSRMAGRFAFKLARRELRRPPILGDASSAASPLKSADS